MLRLDLAQYRELETFAKFGTELDKETKKQLARGERTVEVLKQGQYMPMAVEDQVLIIFALTNGYLDDIAIRDISKFQQQYLEFMRMSRAKVVEEIKDKKDIPEELEKKIRKALEDFKESFSV
jgi:F-type H+-transporting ATPase subunit alpha